MKRVLKVLGVGLLIIVLLAAVGGAWFVRRPWPQAQGTITAAGLTAPVRVLRDSWGIPHIYAENEPDLFFAQGYVHAQDRLWQMELNRRVGSGTLSAVIGNVTLSTDQFMRTMGLRRAAQREWDLLSPPARAILEAYAAGVNAYIDTHRGTLPVEFTVLGVTPEPWTPLDTLVWGKVMAWNQAGNYTIEVVRARIIANGGADLAQRLLPPFIDGTALNIPSETQNYQWAKAAWPGQPAALAAFLSPPTFAQGSNGWVVHGNRTTTGMPLLANDTHLMLGMPSIWYINGLHGGRFNSVGFTFPGVPLIITGHNDQIAWGITTLHADVQDLYLEKLDDPVHPTRYEVNGEWHDLEVIQEIIEVKGAAPVTHEVRFTRHGPLINGTFGIPDTAPPLALRWTLLEGAGVFEGVIAVNLAGNWDEFRAALSVWGAPSQHFIYADRAGNIGYQAAGSIPLRESTDQGLLPMPGWTDDYEWQGTIPFDQLFNNFNPPEGFIASANDEATPDNYPYIISYEWDTYRVKRIREVLQAGERMTAEDMHALQADTNAQPAAELLPYLLAVTPENDLETRALEQVRNWNLHSDVDQVGPSIFQVWYNFLLRNTLQDDLGKDLLGSYDDYQTFHVPAVHALLTEQGARWFDDQTTPQTETSADIARRSLVDALAWLRERYGDAPEQWTWGKLHTITLQHQPLGVSGIKPLELLFNSRSFPAPGDDFTLNVGWLNRSTFAMTGGVSQRMIVDLQNLDNTKAINSTGQSGQVLHPNRDDMIPLWNRVEYVPVPFSQAGVQAAAGTELTLTP